MEKKVNKRRGANSRSSLAQTKYLYRHNAALKILFSELLREHGLIEEVPPWYSPVMPKPAYQNTTSEAF